MAGSYPDPPGHRMALDLDGSVVLTSDGSALTELTQTQKENLNDEDSDAITVPANGWIAAIFPELRDLDGYFVFQSGGTLGDLEYSTDTTNGLDGTWASLAMPAVGGSELKPGYRADVQTISQSGAKAVRLRNAAGTEMAIQALHVFGEPAAGQNPNRLQLWDPANDNPLGAAALDFGDTPRGGSYDRTFRVKNISTSLTANAVTVTAEALSDATPSFKDALLLSADGVNFAGQVSLGNLTPNTISGVITVRLNLPVEAALSVWAARLLAQASSWS